MKWDYLVEDVYDNFGGIPVSVPPNRLMNHEERMLFMKNMTLFIQGTPIPKTELSQWTFQGFLQARGQQGWELVQATRLSTDLEPEPSYWRVIIKSPAKGD